MKLYDFLISTKEITTKEWLSTAVKEVITENEGEFLKRLKEQWESGENEDGRAAGFYTQYTELISKKNPPSSGLTKKAGEPYNFLWSGNLFNSITLIVDDLTITVDSTAKSKDSLFDRIDSEGRVTPDSIFGLGEKNMDSFNEFLSMKITERIINKLNL